MSVFFSPAPLHPLLLSISFRLPTLVFCPFTVLSFSPLILIISLSCSAVSFPIFLISFMTVPSIFLFYAASCFFFSPFLLPPCLLDISAYSISSLVFMHSSSHLFLYSSFQSRLISYSSLLVFSTIFLISPILSHSPFFFFSSRLFSSFLSIPSHA